MESTNSCFLPSPYRRPPWALHADTFASADEAAAPSLALPFESAEEMALSLSSPVPSASLLPRFSSPDFWAMDVSAQPAHALLSHTDAAPPVVSPPSPPSPHLQQPLDTVTPALGLPQPVASSGAPMAAAATAGAAAAVSPVPHALAAFAHPVGLPGLSPSASVWGSVGAAVPTSSLLSSSAKKQKHRAIDAKRRNLEADAMHALQHLVMGPLSSSAGSAAASASASTAWIPAMPAASAGPVPKVTVLQACADYIRSLQAELQRLQGSASASDSSSSAAISERKRMRIDPQAVVDVFSHVEESRVLRNEMFVSASVLLCCMDLTGRWIDVNQRWLQRMCWSRDDVLGRFGSPIAAYMPFITQHPQAQMTFPAGDLVRIRGGCSKGFEYVQHDAMTISQLRSLYQQQKQVIEFVDGFVMGCSKFIEIRWTCWLILQDARPRYFYLSAPDSAIQHVTCTYQQAKQLAMGRSAESAAAAPPTHQRMEHPLSAAESPACTCSQAVGCAPSCVHCSSDCSNCVSSVCGPPSPVHSRSSSASILSSPLCHCCARCSCNTTVPCACLPPTHRV